MSAWDQETRRADAVILTAIRLEFDAVLKVDAGAVAGSVWELATGPSGLPVAFRSFVGAGSRPLRVAVAVAADRLFFLESEASFAEDIRTQT